MKAGGEHYDDDDLSALLDAARNRKVSPGVERRQSEQRATANDELAIDDARRRKTATRTKTVSLTMDPEVVDLMNSMCRMRKRTKVGFVEEAIRLLAEKLRKEGHDGR
jgi:hypothetical protein